MARSTIYRYFVDIRTSKSTDHRKSIHVDACSRTGAIYQALLIIKEHDIKDIYAITVREQSYPIEKRKRQKELKKLKIKKIRKINNLRSIQNIKMNLNQM
jgi:hypothetical protein